MMTCVATSCLIVDDNPTYAHAASARLERDGFSVVGTSSSITDALLQVETKDPDVVLVDVRLGGEDGIECARRIAALPDPPVLILISAYPMPDHPGDLAAHTFVSKHLLSGRVVHEARARTIGG
jgi:CheY-like chemotaxis protein